MLYVIMGRSGSGKTTVSEALSERYGLKPVWSYTPRPKRSPDEKGHIFVTQEEYDNLQNKIAPVFYSGNHYCTTREQLLQSDLFVAEPSVVPELIKANVPFVVICLKISEEVAIERMRKRGNTEEFIKYRTEVDREVFNETKTIMNPEIGYKVLKENIIYISATMPVESIVKKIKEIIENE